jgi:hypothetical protein
MKIVSLKKFNTMAEAYSAVENLYKLFLRDKRRSERVDLTIAVTSKPEKKHGFYASPSVGNDYEVRCHYKDENKEDFLWLQDKINSL